MFPVLICLTCLTLSVFYLAPASVFLFNGSEVVVSVGEVFSLSIAPQMVVLVGGGILALVCGATGRTRITTLCAAISLLVYLQGTLFVWDYGRFDGQAIDWSQHQLVGVLESVLWIGIIIGSQVFASSVYPRAVAVALVSVGLQLVSIGVDLAGGLDWDHATLTAEDSNLYRFSPDRNVVIVMLDGFQSHVFDEILEQSPAIAKELRGFVYFRDTLSVFPTTLMSVPAILSGEIYDNSEPTHDFLHRTLADASLPDRLSLAGFESSVVTRTFYCDYFRRAACTGQLSIAATSHAELKYRDAVKLWDVTLFRHSPHLLKRRIYGDDHKWLLTRLLVDSEVVSVAHLHAPDQARGRARPTDRQQASGLLWSELIGKSDSSSSHETFKFLHFWSSHAPYVLGPHCEPLEASRYARIGREEGNIIQSRCTLAAALDFKRKLAELDVLDNTLFVIMADHGSATALTTLGKLDEIDINRAFPLLLIKPIGASEPFSVSDRPASLADVSRTLAVELGLDHAYGGESLFGDHERSERRYFYYVWKHEYWRARYLPDLQEYVIQGPGRLESSWSVGRRLAPPGASAEPLDETHGRP
jgi:hypothetical protein